MTEDSRSTDPLATDPTEDTPPDEEAIDTEGNTQQAQQPADEVIPAKRYRDLQAEFTKRNEAVRSLQEEILQLRQQVTQVRPQTDPNDPLAQQRAELEAERVRLREEREWAQVMREVPPDLIESYSEFQRGLALNPTPRGAVTAFESALRTYVAKLPATEQEQQKAAPPRKPRVDTSRSAPAPDAIDQKIAGAKADKNLVGHIAALFERGPARPQG